MHHLCGLEMSHFRQFNDKLWRGTVWVSNHRIIFVLEWAIGTAISEREINPLVLQLILIGILVVYLSVLCISAWEVWISWSLFLKLQSQYYYYSLVLSCVTRNCQITHGASCPSACILGGYRFHPSWHTRSTVLLKIARTYKSWWDFCVCMSLLLLLF